MACLKLAEAFNLSDFAYAHRGLWSPEGPTENSLEAFMLAAEHGLGIEFDVRPSSDGIPIIFHDALLDRMTSQIGYVERHASQALIGTPLLGGGAIIDLNMLLELWPPDLPLLCEMKIDGSTDPISFAKSVGGILQRHQGAIAAMSFSSEAVKALPAHLMRGQLILPSEMTGETNLASLVPQEADYMACHISDAANATLQQARQTRPLVTWTVKDATTCEALLESTDSQIFEGFDPALAKRHILNR